MIQEELKPILETIRRKALEVGVRNLSFDKLEPVIGEDIHILNKYVNSNEELVVKHCNWSERNLPKYLSNMISKA